MRQVDLHSDLHRPDSQREPVSEFEKLVHRLNAILGPSGGIDSADVKVDSLQEAMRAYRSNDNDWIQLAFADHSRNYTRNLVDRGNGKANLLILVWTPGKGSPIHDHAEAHCVMKVLKGSLTETLYRWPCESDTGSTHCSASSGPPKHTCTASDHPSKPAALASIRELQFEADQVTYMSDKLGLHRIKNTSPTETAVSLHLYTPPNAAVYGCHIFDELTGKRHHVQQCGYYSEMGRVIDGNG